MAAASFTPQMIAFYKEHANDTLQPNEIATGVCGLVIAYTAVLARVWARRASASKFGWDDWLIAVSLVGLKARLFGDIVDIFRQTQGLMHYRSLSLDMPLLSSIQSV